MQVTNICPALKGLSQMKSSSLIDGESDREIIVWYEPKFHVEMRQMWTNGASEITRNYFGFAVN